jgi:hypothetical protein
LDKSEAGWNLSISSFAFKAAKVLLIFALKYIDSVVGFGTAI